MELTAFELGDVQDCASTDVVSTPAVDETRLTVKSKLPFVRDKVLAYTPGDTVLEALEKSNLNPNYQCREGYCGACRIPISKGEVFYTIDPMATRKDNEILACCCEPVTDIELQL